MLIISFMLKILLMWMFYELFAGAIHEKLQRLCVAWLSSYGAMIFAMILLSPFHILEKNYLLITLLSFIGIGYIVASWLKVHKNDAILAQNEYYKDKYVWWCDVASMVPIVIVFFALVFHSFYYYDTTSDGLMQGMSKLAFIQQNASLYVRFNTVSVNIFANECLGEMNALYYLLMTQCDLAMLLGNAESWLMTYFMFLYAVRVFGYRGKLSGLLAASCSLVYVVVGMALTIKTDMLAICLPVVAVAMLLTYFREENAGNLFAAIIFLGATAASKIAVLPFAGLLLIYLVFHYFFITQKRFLLSVIWGGGYFAVFCNRYVANIFQYGNPFIRAANEKVAPSIDNFTDNMNGMLQGFFEGSLLWSYRTPYTQPNWALTRAFGYMGIAAMLLFGICFFIKIFKLQSKVVYLYERVILLIFLISLTFFMCSTTWYQWNFRYLAGYVMIAYVYAGAVTLNYMEHTKKLYRMVGTSIISIVLICGIVLNSFATFRLGQPVPLKFEEQKSLSRPIRKILFSDFEILSEWEKEEELLYVLENGGKALLMIEFSIPFYMYFGTDHCVKVDMVENESEMIQKYEPNQYDLVVVASARYNSENYMRLETLMEDEGYKKCSLSTAGVFISPQAMESVHEEKKND